MQCSFCGTEIAKGTGLMYVKKDAKIFRFCSRKCEKNQLVLRRKPRNTRWTAEARRNKEQALATAKTAKKKVRKPKKPAGPAKKAPVKAAKKAAKKQ